MDQKTNPKHETVGVVRPMYSRQWLLGPSPRHSVPEDGMPPGTAYHLIHDELIMDGSSRFNLATFCGTWMEPEAQKLMAENLMIRAGESSSEELVLVDFRLPSSRSRTRPSTVYRVQQAPYAIWRIDQAWATHRFQQEILALEQIRHSSVVAIYGLGAPAWGTHTIEFQSRDCAPLG